MMLDLPDEISALYQGRRHHILNERFPRRTTLGLLEFLWAATYFETGASHTLDFQQATSLACRFDYIVQTIEVLDGLVVGNQPINLVHLSDAQRADIVGADATASDQWLDRFLSMLEVPAGSGHYHLNDGPLFVLSIDLLIGFLARLEHDAARRLEATTLRQSAPTAQPTAPVATEASRGLPTATIADLFQCQRRSRETWLKSSPQWLLPAMVARGVRGGATSLWCPVKVAKAMHARKMIGIEALHRKFSNPALIPWREEWDVFYQLFSDLDRS